MVMVALVPDVGSGVEGGSDNDGMVESVGGMIAEVPVPVPVPEPPFLDVVSVAVMLDEGVCKGVVTTSVLAPDVSAVVVSPFVGAVVLVGTAYSRYW